MPEFDQAFLSAQGQLATEEAAKRTHELNFRKERTTQLQKALDDIMTNLEGGVSNAIAKGTPIGDPSIQSGLTQFENHVMESVRNAASKGLPFDEGVDFLNRFGVEALKGNF